MNARPIKLRKPPVTNNTNAHGTSPLGLYSTASRVIQGSLQTLPTDLGLVFQLGIVFLVKLAVNLVVVHTLGKERKVSQ